jgi:serine/threonine protein kinase
LIEAAQTPDRFTFLRRLGAGGMGEVWEATMHGPGGFEKAVAVKRLRTGLGEIAEKQLLEEARVGALLHHPNVVGVYGVDRDPSGWRVAMELVRGRRSRSCWSTARWRRLRSSRWGCRSRALSGTSTTSGSTASRWCTAT